MGGETGTFRELPISWSSRTEAPAGKTSPEELLAAAHAACYSMALSAGLGRGGHPPESLRVSAQATFDKVGDGWKVTGIDLHVTGRVPGLAADEFQKAAQSAADGCPISGALKGNVPIRLTAQLE